MVDYLFLLAVFFFFAAGLDLDLEVFFLMAITCTGYFRLTRPRHLSFSGGHPHIMRVESRSVNAATQLILARRNWQEMSPSRIPAMKQGRAVRGHWDGR